MWMNRWAHDRGPWLPRGAAVGLILFDHYLPMLSARAVDRLADPGLLAVPPASTRYLVNQGAVSNAVYAFPTLRWRPVAPLDVRLGYLVASADGDVIDPYSSAKNGGYNATFGGRSPGSRFLGQELDIALRYGIRAGAGVTVRVGYEAGVFFPGAAFEGVGGAGPVWMGRALGDMNF
jgi:hypothetical protein